MVWLDREHALLFVDVKCTAVKEGIFCIVNGVIHHGNVSSGLDVVLKECTVISGIDHIAWSQDNIGEMDSLDAVHIFNISRDVCTVDIADPIVLRIHNIKLPAFGVDIIMASCAQMLCQRAWFSAYINFNIIDPAVAHI